MTGPWRDDQTVISRLRIRSSGPDALATRLRVGSLLSAMTLQPVGLPPSAILCIRRIGHRLTGRLPLGRIGVAPPPAWRDAVTASIELAARGAVRPARGHVPAHAEAVFFEDRAELLACLARDWCEGSLITRWWWQSLFHDADLAGAVARAWLDAPQWVPAALQHLAESGRGVAFARALGPQDARALLSGMTRSFALPAVQAALDEALRDHSPVQGEEADAPRIAEARDDLKLEPASVAPSPSAPWLPWVPESEEGGLGLAHRCLLGVGLMVQRAPAMVRRPAFAAAVGQWLGAERRPESATTHSAGKIGRAGGTIPPAVDPAPRALNADEETPWSAAASARDSVAGSADLIPDPSARAAWVTDVPRSRGVEATPSPGEDPATAADLRSAPDEVQVRSAAIETEHGGLFYLINLGLFLNLYGDFTTPAEPGISLPLWDFLALVGRELLGEQVERDPVWPLLARLAGRRDQEEPGHGFEPPDDWRMPAEWLIPFAGRRGAWRWAHGGGQLRVAHPAGFPVLDVARDGSPAGEQLRRELRLYRARLRFRLRRKPDAFALRREAGMARWRGWLMPYLRRRLALALGARNHRAAAKTLIRRPARVALTATHLDVHFSLADLPIQLRLAGLDRDPGWVPAAGRFIAFHFA